MFLLLILCGWGTFIELDFGTPAASLLIYRNPFFRFLILLFGVNILAAVFDRIPWKKSHVPFLCAHLGVLLLLVGCWATSRFAVEGKMTVTVDKTQYLLRKGDSVLVFPNQVHEFSTPDHSRHTLCIFSTKLVKAYSTLIKEKVPVNNKFAFEQFYIEKMNKLCGKYSIIQMKGLLYSICGAFDRQAEYKKREEDRVELLSSIFAFVEANYS